MIQTDDGPVVISGSDHCLQDRPGSENQTCTVISRGFGEHKAHVIPGPESPASVYTVYNTGRLLIFWGGAHHDSMSEKIVAAVAAGISDVQDTIDEDMMHHAGDATAAGRVK